MYKKLFICLTALILSSASGALLAQEYEYHPALSDNFSAILGAMKSNNSVKVQADGVGPDLGETGDYIDFEESLGVDGHNTLFNGQLRWKFGRERKWSLSGQYFSNDSKGEVVLTEDIDFDGVTFKEGTFARSGVKLAIYRVFAGRSLVKNAQHDLGIGAGIHNLDGEVFIDGEVIVDGDTTGVQRAEISGSQILPNIGGWYNFSPARRWLLHARVDWISANIGNYDGTLWNASAGVNFQAWRHVGLDLSWQYFNLNGGVTEEDWQGRADMTYSGPVLAVTFNW